MGRKRSLANGGCTLPVSLIIGALFFSVALAQVAPLDSSNPSGYAPDGRIYRAPLLNNPKTLDPARIQDLYGFLVVHQIFDRLVRFSRDLFVIPALAESWTVEDQGRTYRFSLRRDAFFHDGRPVTSGDVVYSISRLFRLSPSPTVLPHLLKIKGASEFARGDADRIAGLEAPGPHALIVRLDQAYAPFLTALGTYHSSIIPAGSGEDEAAFNRNPVGSGPFRMSVWEENREIRLDRFDRYYGGPARLEGILFKIYPGIGIEAVWEDFQSGKVDEVPVYPQIRTEIEKRADLVRIHRPSLSILFYGFNVANPKLRDVQFRSFLSAAIDRVRLTREVYGGQFEPAFGFLPPGLPGYEPPQVAKTQGEGKASGNNASGSMEDRGKSVSLEIVSNSQSPLAQEELRFVQKAWEQVGVKVESKFIPDWAQFEEYLKSENVQVYRYAWFADIPDPDDFLRVLFASDSAVNYMRYNNSVLDEMLKNAVGVLDPVQRAAKYREIQTFLAREVPAVPLLHLSVDVAYQPYVRDVEVTALGSHTTSYHRVWLDRKAGP